MKLSLLAIVLGLIVTLPSLVGLFQPERFGEALRKFPRCTPIGYVLMLIATGWFLYYVRLEKVSDFLTFKPMLYVLFAGVGLAACIFVGDFLAVRGLAVLMLLLAKLMVDAARWVETDWRLVITTWAYVLVIAGMWLTVSPWRMRNLIQWSTQSPERIRLLSGLRLGFGLFVVFLGLTAYRKAEAAVPPQSSEAPALMSVARVSPESSREGSDCNLYPAAAFGGPRSAFSQN